MSQTNKPEPNLESWRLLLVYGVVIVLFLFYAYRLFSLQVIQGPGYLAQADENRTTRISDPTQRGIILARNGVVLARNIASYNVTVTPAELPGTLPMTYEEEVPGAIQEVYRRLSALTGVPVSAGSVEVVEEGVTMRTLTDDTVKLFKPCETDFGIKEILYIQDTTAPYSSVRIKCDIDANVARQIREQSSDLPGVSIEVEAVRDYPTGDLTSEIIGFVGPVPANQPDIGLLLEDYYREKGFVPGRDRVGYAGVENSLQELLGGRNGERYVEVDAAGQELRNLTEPVKPVPGNNIRLTIDTRLQLAARDIMVNRMNHYNRVEYGEARPEKHMRSGAVVAMNPRTGEVLALVSYPSYENNRFARQISGYYYNQLIEDPASPMLNKAISAEFPPGSVFKLPTAIGALNERVVAPEKELMDPGSIFLEERALPNAPVSREREFVCWALNEGGHGMLDWLHGVAESCDVYFYKIGGGYKDEVRSGGLGIWRLGEYARALGYGLPTGIELPGEVDGLIPDPDWKRVNQGESWTTGDTYIASMGQGLILSTPLQVVVSASILGNNGKYMRPTLVREVLDSEGTVIKPFEPDLRWDITKDAIIHEYDEYSQTTGNMKTVEPWVVNMAKDSMRLVVTEGTAAKVATVQALEDLGIPSAGKTGTAEYCDDSIPEEQKPIRCQPGHWPAHAWYFGYAPYDNPEIAVVAFVYNGDEGAALAAPVVAQVIQTYFELKAVDASRGQPQPNTVD